MNNSRSLKYKRQALIGIWSLAYILLAQFSFAQTIDRKEKRLNIKGAIGVTNNGFSFIPSFSLGKPAVIVNLSVDKGKRFSFEPEFRYALEGKPWSFIFIWRYKLIKKERFQVTLGTHLPALNFRTVLVEKNGVKQELIQSQRFFPVFELSPNYTIAKDINLGMFYLYGRGVEVDATKNTHFWSVRAGFSNLKLHKGFYLKFNPQFFYLKMDEREGYYVASSLSLAKRGFPLSISTLINKPLRTTIAGKDFDWNVSLSYSFSKSYVRQ